MTRHTLRVVRRYGLSIVAVALALGMDLILGLREHFSSALFIAAVAFSAWYSGLGPGILSTVLAALALDYFFFPAHVKPSFAAATWLLVFVAVAMFLNLLQEAQSRLAAALRQQDKLKSEFMAVLAHELRNFLNPICTGLDLLRMHAKGDEGTEQTCDTMARQVRNMTSLINDLLDGARIAEGKIQLSLEIVDLRYRV